MSSISDVCLSTQTRGLRKGKGNMAGVLKIYKSFLQFNVKKNSTQVGVRKLKPIKLRYEWTKHIFCQLADKHRPFALLHISFRSYIVDEDTLDPLQLDPSHPMIQFVCRIPNFQRKDVKMQIKDVNKNMKRFCSRVGIASGIDPERPHFDLGFSGTLNKSTVKFAPTASCLVHLSTQPFLVIRLDSIALVSLERVRKPMRNFDMVIVYYNCTKDPIQIRAIDAINLPMLEAWLSIVNVRSARFTGNLNWKAMLEEVRDDEIAFWNNGGWNSLLMTTRKEREEEEISGDALSAYFNAGIDEESEQDEEFVFCDEDENDEEYTIKEEEKKGYHYSDLSTNKDNNKYRSNKREIEVIIIDSDSDDDHEEEDNNDKKQGVNDKNKRKEHSEESEDIKKKKKQDAIEFLADCKKQLSSHMYSKFLNILLAFENYREHDREEGIYIVAKRMAQLLGTKYNKIGEEFCRTYLCPPAQRVYRKHIHKMEKSSSTSKRPKKRTKKKVK